MKNRTLVSLFATWLALGLGGNARAQATTPTPVPEEPVVLSPFVVDSSADKGYQSSVTQSGSRLRTNLTDVAASITVLTNEFMDDLGATDLAGPLALVAGAENDSTQDPSATNSLNQGYVGGDFGDVNTRPNQVSVRGLGNASTTANYISVISAPDRYNIDRAEFLRGANSILFGLASPAGLINYTTKVANLSRNSGHVQAIGDSLGSLRGTIDLNRVLFKNKWALRVDAMNSAQQYKVKTAYRNDERLFLTTTYKPFKNTTVRGFAEYTHNQGRRPTFRTVQDNVSGWLALYNQYAKVLTPAQLAAAFTWNPATSKGLPGDSIVTVNGQTIDLGLLRLPMDGSGATRGTALFYSTPDAALPDGNAILPFATRTATGGAAPAAVLGYFVRGSSPAENRAGYVDPQVTNTGIFPYDTVEIDALPGNYRWERGRKLNVSVDQRLTDDLYLSAAFQRETYQEEQLFAAIAQTQQINIDINSTLPNNQPNPNFMRPFVYGRNVGDHTDEILDNLMLQANYDFDFAKKTKSLGWLGSHRLAALYTHTNDNTLTYKWNFQADNQTTGLNPSLTDSTRLLYQLWYVGDPVQAGDTSLRLTGFPKSVMPLQAGQTLALNYFNTTTGTWQQSATPLHVGRQVTANGRAYNRQINNGTGVSLQSFFWKKKIVTLVGVRRDDVDFYSNTLDTSVQPLLGTSRADYTLASAPVFSNSRVTHTESIVFHATNWLRFLASESLNFAATAPRMTPLWKPIGPQNGKTTEVGFGLGLWDGKLSLRVSAYKSAQNLAGSSASATAGLRILAVETSLYNALQSAGRLSEWYTYGPNGKTTEQYTQSTNVAATQNSVSKGYQAELFYEPMANWHLALNFNEVENTATNIGKEIADFLAVRGPYYSTFIQQGLREDGSTNANPTTSTLFATRLTNTLIVNYLGNIAKEGTSNPGVSKYALKAVTSYNFSRGLLKGFAFGGHLSWESRKVLGYPQKTIAFSGAGLDGIPGVVADTNHPYYGTPTTMGGLFVSYGRRIFRDRIRWKIQLNAQNLFGDQGLRVIGANPDGEPIWGVAPARLFQLSNSFDF